MQILKFNKNYQFYDSFEVVGSLPNTVINLDCDGFGNHFLVEGNRFKLPEKIYSNDKEFIDHVVSVFQKGTKSMAVLLKGKKGLGKSFTSKVICERLGLPVINITKVTNDNMFSFLNQIEQEHIIYIDEFEKLFPNQPKNGEEVEVKQDKFLSFLDGSNTTNSKRFFIITANNDVNEFLINRPSRIRYLRNYTNIHTSTIEEIVEDKLKNSEFRKDLIENLDKDELNVDSLIEIIEEINLCEKPYSYFKDFFNYNVQRVKYDLYLLEDGLTEEFLGSRSFVDSWINESLKEQTNFEYVNDHYLTKFIKEDNVGHYIFSGYFESNDTDENGRYIRVDKHYILKKNHSRIHLAI